MKKLFAGLVLALLCLSGARQASAQANVGGLLYAAQFGTWSVPQGTNGPYAWSSPTFCQINANAVTFAAFTVGTPIQIVDSNPALNEIVVPTAVLSNGFGCSITINPVHQHNSFHLITATGGLQEAINYAIGKNSPAVVVLTTDWSALGGTTALIGQVTGNYSITISDQRTSYPNPYAWNGTQYVLEPVGSGTLTGDANGPASSNVVTGVHFGSTPFTLSTDTPVSPSLPVLGYIAPGVLGGLSGGGGGGGCPEGQCVQNNPANTQTVIQPATTNLNVNNFEGQVWADQYGTGSNGIETSYAQCLAQNGLGFSGCTIRVSQNYTNADVPAGWQLNSGAFSNPPMQVPSGGAVDDQRNGTDYKLYHNPLNSITGQGTGDATTTVFDVSIAQSNAVLQGPNRTGRFNHVAILNGGDEFNFYPAGMPDYLTETNTFGDYTLMDDYIGGIDFGHYDIFNKRSNGDFVGNWLLQTCDAGILSGNSEGCEHADWSIREDPAVFTGTVTGTPSTGATQIHVSATIGGGTQGAMYRWLVNQSAALFSGTQFTGTVSELTTGSAGNSATMPPQVIDSTQNFPVSTMLQICYSGTDNGASGATGCTSGSQPKGYIPSQNYRFTITGGSVTSGVATFAITPTSPQTTPVHLAIGQVVMLYGFPLAGNGAFLNQQQVTVLSAGLSTTQFEANVTGPDTVSTGAGFSTYSPTGYSPAQSIAVGIVPSYTTGGGTGGLPAGFCTPGTIQTSNPSSACYMPASGVAEVTDQIETEPVAFTYSSGTITLLNMQFPHLNGAIFAVGGLATKSVSDLSSQYVGGGTSGTINEVYPIAGSVNSTSFYYVPQRTNLGYASPPLGGSTDGGSDNGGVNNSQATALCFSTTMGNISLTGGTVTFNMGNIAGASGGSYLFYNGLTVALAVTGNTSFSGSYAITNTGGSGFSYTPTSPSGSATTGTVSFCNANYRVLDSARVLSVVNPSNNAVDGTFVLFPNTASLSGATVREPHYQQMSVAGTHETVTQFQPKPFLGSLSDSFTYAGNVSGAGWGLSISNAANGNIYQGGGGTEPLPSSPLSLFGPWAASIALTAPQQTILNVTGFNLAGPSSPLSTFGLVTIPPLPSAFPGYNIDNFCYNPFYNFANRGQALTTGEYIFGNGLAPNCGAGPANGNLVSSVRMGHLIADLDASIPEITSNDVTVAQLSNFPGNTPLVIGTPGSTCYNYEIVSHDKNGGSTVPHQIGSIPCSVNNGNATLNGTNFNRVCAFLNPGVFSYDFLKQVGGVWQSMAVNVAVGNGAAHSEIPNLTCWDDQGGSTSAYSVPTQNTTGSVNANSILTTTEIASVSNSAPSVYATNLTVGNCVQAGAGGLLVTTANPCGSGGGGGGMVYPPAGVGNSSGTAWSTSYQVGTAANDLLQLDGSGNLPAINVAAGTGYLYGNLAGSGIVPVANGGTGTATPGIVAGTNVTVTGTWPNQTINSTSGGSSGFPIVLGSTSIATGSTNTSIAGLTVNGVLLSGSGSTSLFLNQNGAYSSPAVVSSFAAPTGGWPSWLVPSVATATSTPSLTVAASTIPVSAGGTGTASPAIVAGTNITVSGTWPNQTINSTAGGISGQVANTVPLAATSTTLTAPSHLSETGGKDVFTQPVVVNTTGNGIAMVDAAAPAGVPGSSVIWADSTALRMMINNNNSGAVNVATSADLSLLLPLTGGTLSGTLTVPTIVLPGSTSGTITITATPTAGTQTVTFPAASGAVQLTGAEVPACGATPTFSGSTTMSRCVMTVSITSFTMPVGASGAPKILCFKQSSGGSLTVTPPSSVHGFFSSNSGQIGATANLWNCQQYTADNADGIWLATSGGVVNE